MRKSHSALPTVFHCLAIFVLVVLVPTPPAVADPEQWKRGGFTTDFSKTTVSLDSIFSGGPPKDGIPSIDDPGFETAESVSWLEDREPVIRLELDGVVKAYPLQILIWHEIVNDTIGQVPVSVTYCPLCNSSIVFDRRLDGDILDFGTTGLLRNSDLVMYDRQSESWWQQFTGKGIVGIHAGRDLKMIPSTVVAFGDFKKNSPNADVLARPDPPRRNYGSNPYAGYDSRTAPYPLFQGELPEDINPMARVVVVRDDDQTFAVTLEHVRRENSVPLSDNVQLRWTGEQASILDKRETRKGRIIGSVEAIRTGEGDERPLVHDVTFAFVVHAFHPELPILGIKTP
ncbi:MAG: DUF3179 domain-containing protein [Roseibium sp.]|uniref:DUF3179 domain-containing protein n=1 Tax=Roseibium sp. TaxID=1936156 RepID=UPI00261330D2|nr:DUF3179 domain-containing protein [Roseibium sp.]MCV0424251.1 DUF3179 domain-containing protein [Roseibium sp.]